MLGTLQQYINEILSPKIAKFDIFDKDTLGLPKYSPRVRIHSSYKFLILVSSTENITNVTLYKKLRI
jgi:hypothetical protein